MSDTPTPTATAEPDRSAAPAPAPAPAPAGVHRIWLVTGLLMLILAGAALVYSLAPGSSGPAVTVSGAYVREPASPDVASAYLTVVNHTRDPLTLTAISADAARSAHVMTEHDGAMSDQILRVRAHGSSVLRPNAAHLMLEAPRALTPGRTVHLTLTFDDGTTVAVDAPVVGLLDPAPTS